MEDCEKFLRPKTRLWQMGFPPLVKFLVSTVLTAAIHQCLSTSKKGLLNHIISLCEVMSSLFRLHKIDMGKSMVTARLQKGNGSCYCIF